MPHTDRRHPNLGYTAPTISAGLTIWVGIAIGASVIIGVKVVPLAITAIIALGG